MDIPLVVCYAGLLHQSSKNKKNPPRKNFLIFREIKIFDSKIKKCIIFPQKKAFLIFQEMETPKTFCISVTLIFRKTETLKNFLYLRK